MGLSHMAMLHPLCLFLVVSRKAPLLNTSRKNRIGTPPDPPCLRLNSACSSRSWPSKRPGSTEAMVQVSSRSNSPCSWPSPHMLTGWMKGDFFYWDREIRRMGSLLTTTFCRVLGSLVRSFEKIQMYLGKSNYHTWILWVWRITPWAMGKSFGSYWDKQQVHSEDNCRVFFVNLIYITSKVFYKKNYNKNTWTLIFFVVVIPPHQTKKERKEGETALKPQWCPTISNLSYIFIYFGGCKNRWLPPFSLW